MAKTELSGPPARSKSRKSSRTASATINDSMNSLDEEKFYDIRFNDPTFVARKLFPSNYMRTTKYTVLTFLPLNLYDQFHRLYNLYFLLAMILTFIPSASPLTPWGSVIPLILVLTVTAIKDALEDFQRYRADRKANGVVYNIIRDGIASTVQSRDILPGDIVQIHRSEQFPADLILLSSSERDGSCYIDTNQLDGETNLKRRMALSQTNAYRIVHDLCTLQGSVHCDMPNEHLYKFNGRLFLNEEETKEKEKEVPLEKGECSEINRKEKEQQQQEIKTTTFISTDKHSPLSPLSPLPLFPSLPLSPSLAGPFSLSVSQTLLRGASLRNTSWVYGVVVYAGRDTKIYRNLKKSSIKISTQEILLNRIILGIFLINLCVYGLSLLFTGLWQSRQGARAWYLMWPVSGAHAAGVQAIAYYILYTYMIPISLVVTIEICRLVQIAFMVWDPAMRMEEGGEGRGEGGREGGRESTTNTPSSTPPPRTTTMSARSSNLNEDLGLISHIFTDKTGTLTENVMRLVAWQIGDDVYDQSADREILRKAMLRDSPDPRVVAFCTAVALCNAVIPTYSEEDQLMYESQSPDETAIVEALRDNGVVLKSRSSTSAALSVLGRDQHYELIETLEFTSERRRMSVLVRDCASGELFLLMKGADTALLPRLDIVEEEEEEVCMTSSGDQRPHTLSTLTTPSLQSEPSPVTSLFQKDPTLPPPRAAVARLESQLLHFARDGLRTLVIAWRRVSPSEYAVFQGNLREAQNAMFDRDERVTEVFDQLEANLILLGATAVEDRLQDGVPDTIEFLLQAGIHVWMLTGDKQETAINIGYSSKLLRDDTELFLMNGHSSGECSALIERGLQLLQRQQSRHVAASSHVPEIHGFVPSLPLRKSLTRAFRPKHSSESLAPCIEPSLRPQRLALVIDGTSLTYCLREQNLAQFLRLCEGCSSVICCRMAPIQKSDIVQLVKRKLKRICLAIGDGANDVSMIETANIGVGIQGKEGTQAARASDYAIGQFKSLKRLLMVHGRYSYLRLSTLIAYSFYKNMAFIMVQFWFGFFSGWSGQVVYDDLIMALYNVAFTSITPFLIGIFEKDVKEGIIEAHPELYRACKKGAYLNWRTVALSLLSGVWHSLVVFFGVMLACGPSDFLSPRLGRALGLPGFLLVTSACIILVVNAKVSLIMRHWTWINAAGVALSLVIFIVFMFLVSLKWTIRGSAAILLSMPEFYFLLLVIVVMALMLDYIGKYVRRQVWPTDVDIIQEYYALRRMRKETATQSVSVMVVVDSEQENSARMSADVESVGDGDAEMVNVDVDAK